MLIVASQWGAPVHVRPLKPSSAMEWAARNKLAIPNIIHILDDFLILEKFHEACAASHQRFLHFCEDIGDPMAPEKTEGPNQVLTFAGIELDCLILEVRLSMEKLTKSWGQSAICCPGKEFN